LDKESNIKIVGKRVEKSNVDWKEVNNFLKLVVVLCPKNRSVPKGIYKFKSHEESDKWIMKVLTDR
jgi:hypothetical protein